MIVADGCGNTAKACGALNLGRSPYYLTCQKSEVSHLLEHEIISKNKDHPRYGCRRITAECVEMDIWSMQDGLSEWNVSKDFKYRKSCEKWSD